MKHPTLLGRGRFLVGLVVTDVPEVLSSAMSHFQAE